jgi:hypothetical protein
MKYWAEFSSRVRMHIVVLDIFLKATTDTVQLRETLHGKQKGRMCSTCRLQNLGEVAITERGKLIQDHAEERTCGPLAFFFTLVPLPNNQLQVL